MTRDADVQGRRLKFTLVLRDESDDSSIVDIVRVALEDGLRATTDFTLVTQFGSTSSPRRIAHRDDLATDAREAIEKALAEIPTPTNPKFDPAKWAEQLSKVWQVLRAGTAKGVKLKVKTDRDIPENDPS